MILENKQEEDAFDFVCKLADAYTERICNDLNPKEVEKFKGLEIEGDDENGDKIMHPLLADYDIIHWLQRRKLSKTEEVVK